MAAISKQQLENASVDADDLAEVTNGTDNVDVTSRLGKIYPTLAKWFKEATTYVTSFNTNAATAISTFNSSAAAAFSGFNTNAATVLAQNGYTVPVAYVSGINLTTPNQTVSYNGSVYAPIQNQLPFTTSGTFETAKFRLIQGIAFSDLAAVGGSNLVGTSQIGTGAVLRTQLAKNNDIANLLDYGAAINGIASDNTSATNAITAKGGFQFKGTSVLRNLPIAVGDVTIAGPGEFVQDTLNQHTIIVGNGNADPSLFIKNIAFRDVRFGTQPVATSDDFSAISFAGVKYGSVIGGYFTNTENAVRISYPSAAYGSSIGSTDTLVLGANFYKVRRFIIQVLQSSHGRYIGISANNDGDNKYSNSGQDSGSNNNGNNAGFRIAGNGTGNIIAASNIRDRSVGVTFQLGQSHCVISGCYFGNMLLTAIQASSSSSAYRNSHVISGTVVKDSGAGGISFRRLNRSRFDGLIDVTGKEGSSGAQGIDLYGEISPTDEIWFMPYNAGTGVVPANETLISQGGVTGLLLGVFGGIEAYAATAVGAAMPATGIIKLHSPSGRFIVGALTGIGASATEQARCGDGRHRVDATVTKSNAIGVRVGSNKNLVTAIVDGQVTGAACEVSGSRNIVTLQSADGIASSNILVSGNENTIDLNESSGNTTALNVTGNGNVIKGNVEGLVVVSGTNNIFIGKFNNFQIGSTSTNTTIVGEITGTLTDSNRNGKLIGLLNGVTSGTSTVSTDATGFVTIIHGLKRAASSFQITVRGTVPRLFTVNPLASATTSSVRFYSDLAGTVLASTAITFDWEAKA